MQFTFSADFAGNDNSGYFLSCLRRGDDGKSFRTQVPANQKLTVKTSLGSPGFVSIEIYLTDKAGNRISYQQKTSRKYVGFFAGAAAEPEKLTDCGKPEDFDAFWAKQKKRLAAVERQGKTDIRKVRTCNGCDIYAVSIPCAGPRPATGYLSIPVNAAKGTRPIRVKFFGYGDHIPGVQSDTLQEISMFLNVHGQELGQSPEYYRNFFKSIRSNGKPYAFDPIQNSDPEQAFFNGMAMRVMRTLEYLKPVAEILSSTVSVGADCKLSGQRLLIPQLRKLIPALSGAAT